MYVETNGHNCSGHGNEIESLNNTTQPTSVKKLSKSGANFAESNNMSYNESHISSKIKNCTENISGISPVSGCTPMAPAFNPRTFNRMAPPVQNFPATNKTSSDAIRSPYAAQTPLPSISTNFFPSTSVSSGYPSSQFVNQPKLVPNIQSNSLENNINSSNVGLAGLQNKVQYTLPTSSIQYPLASAPLRPPPIPVPPVTSNMSAINIPLTRPPPGYCNPSNIGVTSHSIQTNLPPSLHSPSGPLTNNPLSQANGSQMQSVGGPQEVLQPLPSPASMFNGRHKAAMQPPLGSIGKGNIALPPTSFAMAHTAAPILNKPQSYVSTSAYSSTAPPTYSAVYSPSQSTTTNMAINQYPIQQQPSTVNQLSKQLGGLSVAQQGWNRGWGTTSIDLMQQRCLLPPGGVLPPKPVIAQENVNSCSPDVFRCTVTRVPESNSVLQKARLPFGILVHPFKDVEQLTVVNGCTIVRCRSCRTYINPFIVFKGERKWECNLCFRVNDLPEEFQYDPVTRTYGDPSRRPECRETTIEYIAPQEYLLRPPQPACYLYVLDVSRQAIETGYLQIVCDILLSRLDDIPGDKRTLVGFITFSTSIQFYMIAEDQKMVNVLDIGDINNVFLPSPQDLLVNLNENRELVEELLMTLPEDFSNTHSTQTCLGAAITAAHKLLAPIGGRITVMATTLPTMGPGNLKSREDPNQRAAKDISNLGPATDFYKKYALECSAHQIAVDLFTFNSQYIDLATITGISKFSGGCIHHFPSMNVAKNTPNVAQFRNCFDRYVTRKIGFEAVMRIRATRGLAITNFHGNFFVRSTDLLSLPNINPDAGFGMQVIIEETLHNIRQACFQAALLYTSSQGERRIRVHTMCLPVSANILDIVNSADQQAMVGFLSKLAVDRCLTSQMSDAREAVVNACADAFGAYKVSASTSLGFPSPVSLHLLPMYCLSILKSVSLRYGMCTKLDDRIFAMCELKSLPLKHLIKNIYPDLYAVHNLTEKGAININDLLIPQPPRLHLSAEFLDRAGAYLLDGVNVIVIYVRNYVSPNWLNNVFGITNFASIPQPMHDDPLPELDNSESELVRNFVSYLQMSKPYPAPLSIIKEDSPERNLFIQNLVEDRSEASHSYVEFLQYIKSQMK